MDPCNIIIWVWSVTGCTVAILSVVFQYDDEKWANKANTVFYWADRLTMLLAAFWIINDISKLMHTQPIKIAFRVGLIAVITGYYILFLDIIFNKTALKCWCITKKIANWSLLYFFMLLILYLMKIIY